MSIDDWPENETIPEGPFVDLIDACSLCGCHWAMHVPIKNEMFVASLCMYCLDKDLPDNHPDFRDPPKTVFHAWIKI